MIDQLMIFGAHNIRTSPYLKCKRRLVLLILVFILIAKVSLLASASYSGQEVSASRQIWPDSLRVTIDAGEFHWQRLRYEAELRVAAFYPPASAANRPDSLTMFVDLQFKAMIFETELKLAGLKVNAQPCAAVNFWRKFT